MIKTFTVKEQNSNEMDNFLKIHSLEERDFDKVLKEIFSLR